MGSYLKENEARKLICDIGRKMYAKGFVAANDGNITVRVADDEVIATPTGVNKGDLEPGMLLRTTFDGKILAGDLLATSELPMHLAVYQVNPAVQSTCHSHAPYLSAFAIAGMTLDLAISPETTFICGTVPVAPYAMPGTPLLAESIKPYVKDYSIVNLSNHGPLSWGDKPHGAWFVHEAAEAFAMECVLLKYIIGNIRPVSNHQIESLAENLKITLNPLRRTKSPDTTTNTESAALLSGVLPASPRLSDEDVERIASRVAEKLAGKK